MADNKKSNTAQAGKKKQKKKNIPMGIAHIHATFNNTIVTMTDMNGNVISWSSAGSHGFKGSRKATPFAAQITAQAAAQVAVENGMRTANVWLNGPGSGRESALRAIQSAGINVAIIKDLTPIPHNGCRPRKRRRV
ncbi:MAG: 30S ribosomal protein S11 [Deltaproteobacteria bacterium]|jgi:small subunit ribosomal protein S11|nr:30S ribosomal protein S11 [Deltaproteobacteria bacterium]